MSADKGERMGVVLALVGALLFSTKAVLVKLAYQYEVDTLTLLFLRMAFALPFYLVALMRVPKYTWKRLEGTNKRYWIGVLGAGFLGYYASSFLDFLGLQYIDASVERLILFIYPTIIAILAYFVFGQRISKIQRLALVTSYIGLVFIFWNRLGQFSWTDGFWKGSLLIFLCAITFATFLVMSQWLIKYFGPSVFTALSMVAACLMVCLHFAIAADFSMFLSGLPYQVYLYAAFMAVVATVLPSYMVNMAIQRIGAVRMAIISSVGPFSTISLAYWLLGERLDLSQIIGAVLIIVGVTIVSVERKKKA